MPVQDYYAFHKYRHGSKANAPQKTEVFDLKPSPAVIRDLMAYAAALSILKSRTLGNLTILLN